MKGWTSDDPQGAAMERNSSRARLKQRLEVARDERDLERLEAEVAETPAGPKRTALAVQANGKRLELRSRKMSLRLGADPLTAEHAALAAETKP